MNQPYPPLPDQYEAVAHMYPWDLDDFKEGEKTGVAFSIPVGCPEGKSVPLWTGAQMRDYVDADRAQRQASQYSGIVSDGGMDPRRKWESPQPAVNEAQDDEGGPIRSGWQATLGDGHAGYGVYAHMDEYPEEGAVLLIAAQKGVSEQR